MALNGHNLRVQGTSHCKPSKPLYINHSRQCCWCVLPDNAAPIKPILCYVSTYVTDNEDEKGLCKFLITLKSSGGGSAAALQAMYDGRKNLPVNLAWCATSKSGWFGVRTTSDIDVALSVIQVVQVDILNLHHTTPDTRLVRLWEPLWTWP